MPGTARVPETTERVWQFVAKSPNQSMAKQASSLNFKPSAVCQILSQDLSMHPYQIVLARKLNPADLLDQSSYLCELLEFLNRYTWCCFD